MLQQCYSVAVDRNEFDVAGRTLAPLTLYHCRVLDCFDLPLVEGGSFDVPQLVLMIAICSMRTKDEIDELICGDFAESLKKLTSLVVAGSGDETASEIEAYKSYYTQSPRRSSDKEKSSPRTPWWGQAKSYLVEYCGFTNDTAWDCIVSDAMCEIAYHSARHDDKSLLSDVSVKLAEMQDADGYTPPTQEELKERMYGKKTNV